jgi:hypothetical protein
MESPAPQVPERKIRAFLRDLDALLAEEIRDAGTLDPSQLARAATSRLGKDVISQAIVDQWWEYAWRRGWLEEAGMRCRLSSVASVDLQAARDRTAGPRWGEWAKAIARWTIAGGVVGLAGILSGKNNLAVAISVLVILGALVVTFAIAEPISRLMDRPFDIWIARQACDWLDGRPVRGSIRSRAHSKPRRLYGNEEFEAPCLVSDTRH